MKLIPGFSTTGKTGSCYPNNPQEDKIQYFSSLRMVSAEEKRRDKKKRRNYRASREERIRRWMVVGEDYLFSYLIVILVILKPRIISESYFIKNINILKLTSLMGKLRQKKVEWLAQPLLVDKCLLPNKMLIRNMLPVTAFFYFYFNLLPTKRRDKYLFSPPLQTLHIWNLLLGLPLVSCVDTEAQICHLSFLLVIILSLFNLLNSFSSLSAYFIEHDIQNCYNTKWKPCQHWVE